jgi:hypothetical protein
MAMIGLAPVDHGHETDGAGVNDGERHDRILAEHEHVEGIVVFCQRLRDEAVVRGIVDGGIENAIEFDQAAGFVEFVLHARSERDLDHAIEFLRELVAGSHVVPGMDHGTVLSSQFSVLSKPSSRAWSIWLIV